ncbi:MAG: UbiA prenyltransferase family protein [Bifidobacteriaceae bacterium]|nr:UbiA prenyltransferase family protein [Bifidobacteriaceae bacterium]
MGQFDHLKSPRQSVVSAWITLIRPFHWSKNILVIFPLFFSLQLFNVQSDGIAILGFFTFSFITSSVYVFNDLKDAEKDRKHGTKKNRPIASGAISRGNAVIGLIVILLVGIICALVVSFISGEWFSLIFLGLYLALNIAYSLGLKNIPIVDVTIIAAGFVLRVFYGGAIIDVAISDWLFLTIAAASFFLGFGKRRNEIKSSGSQARVVLSHYDLKFLTPILYVFLGLTVTFYSLWAVSYSNTSGFMKYTIALVMVITAEYSRIIEGDSDGDPAEVLRHSKKLMLLVLLFIILMVFALYVMP